MLKKVLTALLALAPTLAPSGAAFAQTQINLQSQVKNTLPVANGGTGTATASATNVFAGPISGSPAAPAMRPLVSTDLPTFGTSAAGIVPASGGGTANFLRADGTWTSNFGTPSALVLTNATGLPAASITGTVAAANGGAGSANGILKANGSGTVSAATANTDYLTPTGPASALTVTPTGASGSRTVAQRAADVVNVKDNSVTNAVGNAVEVGGCTIAASSTTLTCSGSSFNSGNVGSTFYLQGAGTGFATLTGTIAGYTNSTTLTLSTPAVQATPSYGLLGAPLYPTVIATPGTGYAIGDTITLTGGTARTNAVFTVSGTQVVSASVAAGGTGGTTGACTVTGTTGTGTLFTASGTVTSGVFGGTITITNAGAYTASPTSLTEPVTGCGLTGTTMTIALGVQAVNPTNRGDYTTVPTNPTALGSTSGSGSGATFTTTSALQAGNFLYGNDDTSAFAASCTLANSTNKKIYIPSASYMVAPTPTTPVCTFTRAYWDIAGEGQSSVINMATDGELFRFDISTIPANDDRVHDFRTVSYQGAMRNTNTNVVRLYCATPGSSPCQAATFDDFYNLYDSGTFQVVQLDKTSWTSWGDGSTIQNYGNLRFINFDTDSSTGLQPYNVVHFDSGPGAHNTYMLGTWGATNASLSIGDGTAGAGDQLVEGIHMINGRYGLYALGPADLTRYGDNWTITGNQFDGITVNTVYATNIQLRLNNNNSTASVGISCGGCTYYKGEDRYHFQQDMGTSQIGFPSGTSSKSVFDWTRVPANGSALNDAIKYTLFCHGVVGTVGNVEWYEEGILEYTSTSTTTKRLLVGGSPALGSGASYLSIVISSNGSTKATAVATFTGTPSTNTLTCQGEKYGKSGNTTLSIGD